MWAAMRALLLAFAVTTAVAQIATEEIIVEVSEERAPAGGVAQFKIWLAGPAPISGGSIAVDFPGEIFSGATGSAVFSAFGEAFGTASYTGLRAFISFTSPLDGVGLIRDLPVAVINAALRPNAIAGTSAVIRADAGLRKPDGTAYRVTTRPGRISVGDGLSIRDVRPGGGQMEAGSEIGINGGGFDALTRLEVDGLAVASYEAVSPRRIEFTLAAPAEMTGKRIRVTNSRGEIAEWFPFLDASQSGGHALFPMRTYRGGGESVNPFRGSGGLALHNQNPLPVEVKIRNSNAGITGVSEMRLESGQYVYPVGSRGDNEVQSPLPIRMLSISDNLGPGGSTRFIGPVEPRQPWPRQTLSATASVELFFTPGGSLPSDFIAVSSTPYGAVNVRLEPAGGDWLTIEPRVLRLGIPYDSGYAEAKLARPMPAGEYRMVIRAIPEKPDVDVVEIPVTLTVSATPLIRTRDRSTRVVERPGTGDVRMNIPVTGIGGPAPFRVTTETDNGGRWLIADPTSGATDAEVRVRIGDDGFGAREHAKGRIIISGPANSQTIEFDVSTPRFFSRPEALRFQRRAGDTATIPAVRVDFSHPLQGPPIIRLDNGGQWLTSTDLGYSVNPAGLAEGSHTGSLTAISAWTGAVVTVPVTFVSWSGFISLGVSPAENPLLFRGESGNGNLVREVQVAPSRNAPLPFDYWGTPSPPFVAAPLSLRAPTRMTLGVVPFPGPGTLDGNFFLSPVSGGAVVVPARAKITFRGPTSPPVIGSVTVSGRTATAAGPRDIVVIRGLGLGPGDELLERETPSGGTVLNGTRVLFNGTPAVILDGWQSELTVVVPGAIGDTGPVSIEVEYKNVRSLPWGLPRKN